MALSTIQFYGTPGTARRDVARCRQEEPLRITIQRGSWPRAASRDAAWDTGLRQPIARAPRGPLGGPGGGPIGVVKLLRARGGCLGVIRFRAWKAAKSPGELPNERRARNARATRGTETSQYPEERKSTETPSVAASERGLAQTGRDTARGCGAGIMGWTKPSRSPLEKGTTAGESPVGTRNVPLPGTQVGSGTGNPA